MTVRKLNSKEKAETKLADMCAAMSTEARTIISNAIKKHGNPIKEMMIEKGKAALIIDHDLLFIDYLSKKLLVFEGIPARKGVTFGPYNMVQGMNHFLKGLEITFRRDEESNRPRINKSDSQKDKEQKASGQLYYTG